MIQWLRERRAWWIIAVILALLLLVLFSMLADAPALLPFVYAEF